MDLEFDRFVIRNFPQFVNDSRFIV